MAKTDKAPTPPRPRGRPPKNRDAGPAPRAPAIGDNGPDEGVFLRHFNAIRNQAETAKSATAVLATLYKAAEEDGLSKRELKAALKNLTIEPDEREQRAKRLAQYMAWLGQPIGTQAELPLAKPAPADSAARWRKVGDDDGRAGRANKIPEGCAGEDVAAYQEGWAAGQEALMRGSKLTAAAFEEKPAEPAPFAPLPPAANDAPRPQVTLSPDKTVLILKEEAFRLPQAGNLDDASRKTLVSDALVAAFDDAERVVAVFGGKKRVLKEPGYVDDGSEDGILTDQEDVAPEEVSTLLDELA